MNELLEKLIVWLTFCLERLLLRSGGCGLHWLITICKTQAAFADSQNIGLLANLASFPGSGEEEREPGMHCLRMRQIPLVTCILVHYTKITVNFYIPAERLHCMVILPVGYIKSKTILL